MIEFIAEDNTESRLAGLIETAARKAVAAIVADATQRAIEEFETRLSGKPACPPPLEPKIPFGAHFQPEPANGLCIPLPGWQDRVKAAVADFTHKWGSDAVACMIRKGI